MIEYTPIELWTDSAGYTHMKTRLPGGLRGPNVSFKICSACASVVIDEATHTKHHQTPVVG